jgi:pyruvate dehydrogenase E1 component beta subunit
MFTRKRTLSYGKAINEAIHQVMEKHSNTALLGQGVQSPWYVGNTCNGLVERFGELRVIDTPVSENAMTGVAVGLALAGIRTIILHPRMDFMAYAFDPIVNQAANWSYMSGGRSGVPVVFWGIINRGGEQAAQHSQALHTMFAHVPGLKVVMPATPYDAKGLLIAAMLDENPVVFIDDRCLYDQIGYVPEELYKVNIGQPIIRTHGEDVTVVACSSMAVEATKAFYELEDEGISIEVIDLRTIKPLNIDKVIESIKKTGRLVIADVGWRSFGISAEIIAQVMEKGLKYLKRPIIRIALPDTPAPASRSLESVYYRQSRDVCCAVRHLMK